MTRDVPPIPVLLELIRDQEERPRVEPLLHLVVDVVPLGVLLHERGEL